MEKSLSNLFMSEMKKNHAAIIQFYPFVSLIVPVTGESPFLAANLNTLVNQCYRHFEVIFVLQDENDPADAVVERIVRENKRALRIYSGSSMECSQKNHNLLAGIKEAGEKPDILVFCDSGHNAQPDWLQGLLYPILSNASCLVSSGYHQVYPEKPWICSQGRAICVLTLDLIRQLPYLGQPWGGATAIRREAFENIVIAEIWEKNIVDDVSLAKVLQDQNLSVGIANRPGLKTRLEDPSYLGWVRWLTRQWAYLKFIFPGTWLVAGLFCFIVAVTVIVSVFTCVVGIFIPFSSLFFYCSLGGSVSFLLFTTVLYFKHPAPGPVVLWFFASLSAVAIGAYCHFRTWFSKTIDWAGILYRVGKNGEVETITRGYKS